jgi:hypothetical protein
MARQKLHVGQSELIRVLSDGKPDLILDVFDPEWGHVFVHGYRWETMQARSRAQSDFAMNVASLVKKRMLKVVTIRPKLWRRLVGGKPTDYAYLTPLGEDTALLEDLKPDDYDRGYESRWV